MTKRTQEAPGALLDAYGKPALIVSDSGRILQLNRLAASDLNDGDTLSGEPLEQLLVPGQFAEGFPPKRMRDYLQDHEDFTTQITLRERSDDVKPVIARFSEINAEEWSAEFLMTYEEIYARDEALEPLRQSRNDYRELFENAGEALLLIDPGRTVIDDCNRRARDLFGYETEELAGRRLDSLAAADVTEAAGTIRDRVRRTNRSGAQLFEWKAAKRDGSVFWVEVRFSSVTINYEDRILVSVRDISERRRTRKLLKERERRFRQLFNSTAHALVLVNQEGEIEQMNDSAEELFGYRDAELSGEPIETLVPPERRSEHVGLRKDYTESPEQRPMGDVRDIRAFSKNGEKIPVEIGLSPITIDGETKILADVSDVSEQREAEEELRSSKERFQAILETTNDGFWEANLDREIIDCNQAFADLLGREPEDVIGLSISDFEYVENSDEIKKHQRKIMREGHDRFETQFERSDESLVDVQVTVNYMEDRETFICFTRDISERKKYQHRLTELTETTDDILWMTDADWESMLFVNSAYEEIFGQSIDALKRDPTAYLECVHPDDRDEVVAAMEKMKDGESVDLEYRVNESEDYERWVWVSSQPIKNNNGDVVRVAGIGRDITERKKFREALRQSNEELKNFGNVVTHDLKQPLRTITSYLELLDQRFGEQLPTEAGDYIDRTIEGTHRMKELMDRLNQYSSVNFTTIDPAPVDLNEVLETVIENLKDRLREQDATINYSELPVVKGNFSLLEDLFRNLIDNAIRYRGEEPPRITIERSRRKGRPVIAVTDNGIGIPEEYQDRIFKVFERLHTDDEIFGTGIGLAVCKKIVNVHRGEIYVDSAPGEGTTFSVELPLHDTQEG